MVLKLGRSLDVLPATFADTSIGLISCTIAETDATAYSTGTAYIVGNIAMDAGNHKVYTCIQAHTNKPPYTAANVGPALFWLLVGFTNRWRIFDNQIGYGSDGGSSGFVLWRLNAGAALSEIGVMNVVGKDMTVNRMDASVARVNLALHSETFTSALGYTAVLTTVTGDTLATRDPLYMNLADLISETVTASEKGMDSVPTISYISGNTYTVSMYAKRSTGSPRNLRITLPTAAFGASFGNFTLSGVGTAVSGSGGVTATIEQLIDGWYRCSVTKVATANATAIAGSFRILDATLSATYTGATNSGLFVFGYQANAGGVVPYQPILGSQWYERTLLRYVDWSAATDILLAADVFVPVSTYLVTDLIELYVSQRLIGVVKANVMVGEVVFAIEELTMGELNEPVESSFLDFSVKDRDTFGNVTLLERSFADDTNYAFTISKNDRQLIRNIIRRRRAARMLFWETDDPDNLWGLLTFGFVRSYTMPALGAATNFVTLDTEGLT